MANKVKRISINALEKAISTSSSDFSVVSWNELEINVKRYLSWIEMREFVRNVSEACCQDNKNGNGVLYVPENKDFAIRIAVISLYTNLSLPADISRQYDILYCSGVYDVILQHIDMTQFNIIISIIDESIEYSLNANMARINEAISGLDIVSENIQKQVANTFGNINSDDIQKLFSAFTDGGGLDEEKLMKAYLENKN